MFPAHPQMTAPEKFSRCRDFSRLPANDENGKSENTNADASLAVQVDHALWKDDVLRAMEYREIDVNVINGTVYLDGYIASTVSNARIEKALQGIPGVLGLKNNLILDDRLTFEVAASLGELEHLYDCKFFTGVSHGVVSLNGKVGDETIKLLAEKRVASHPGVRAVINCVHIQGVEAVTPDQTLLQPNIGEEILFLDGVSGVVSQVIINPSNRRVVAMTLRGRFADQRQELVSMNNNQDRLPERLIVIPMDLVRYLTKFSGFLSISSKETDRYADFEPTAYCAPPLDWAPPYPYCTDEVLFPVESGNTAELTEKVPGLSLQPAKVGPALTEQLLTNDSLGG